MCSKSQINRYCLGQWLPAFLLSIVPAGWCFGQPAGYSNELVPSGQRGAPPARPQEFRPFDYRGQPQFLDNRAAGFAEQLVPSNSGPWNAVQPTSMVPYRIASDFQARTAEPGDWPYYRPSTSVPPTYAAPVAPLPSVIQPPANSVGSSPAATMPIVQPQPAAPPPQTVAKTANPPATTPTAINKPFDDREAFGPDGREWFTWSIAEYTGRFPAGTQPELGVKDWILRSTGQQAWFGQQASSLRVTHDEVHVYHTAEMAQRLGSLMGRFLNYHPGVFQGRVTVIEVRDRRWRDRLSGQFTAAAGSENSPQQAWLISDNVANELLTEIASTRHGQILVDQPLTIANGRSIGNGQPAEVRWSPLANSRAVDPQGSQLVVQFSPLIGEDERFTELVAHVSLVQLHTRGGTAGEQARSEIARHTQVPAGRQLLLSLGLVPPMVTTGGLFGGPDRVELLVLIQVTPWTENRILAGNGNTNGLRR